MLPNFSGGGTRRPNPNAGAIQGLQAARPGGGGASTMPRAGQQQASAYAAQQNDVNSRWAPHIGANGRTMLPIGPKPVAMGTNGMGRAVYGWANGQPVTNPTINYVQDPNQGDFGGGGGGGPRGPSGPTPPPMGGLIDSLTPLPEVDSIMPIDDADAVRNAYARAKDTAGQQGRAALDALMDVQGARGIVGSGIGVNEAGGVIAEGARQLGDFNREQAIQRVENERWRQGTNYQGRITQRGQNLNQQELEFRRRMFNAGNSPYGHVQGGPGVNPVPRPYPRY